MVWIGSEYFKMDYLAKNKEKKKYIYCANVVVGGAGGVVHSISMGNINWRWFKGGVILIEVAKLLGGGVYSSAMNGSGSN